MKLKNAKLGDLVIVSISELKASGYTASKPLIATVIKNESNGGLTQVAWNHLKAKTDIDHTLCRLDTKYPSLDRYIHLWNSTEYTVPVKKSSAIPFLLACAAVGAGVSSIRVSNQNSPKVANENM